MDIIVCIKQIYDLGQIKVDTTTKYPITEGVARKISDFDKNALEEALRIKEKHGGTVLALIGGTKEAAKEALAMGADEAVIYSADSDSLGTATILAEIIHKMKYDLILCGEASIDEFSFQIGPRLAQALGIPVLTYARKMEPKDNEVVVERNLENRYEIAKARLPALVTVTKEINEPRIPTLLQILGASKKKITEISLEKQEAGIETLRVTAIEMKRKEVILKDIEELAMVITSESR
ncbi:MAG TPA: electron transfer flavoprotein subunit beta/FixA family protein [Candidatus Wunengus sp. YC65]|uniref:electron transfer flavoprotein subunit beta/FixA family protein n=1 Tax=Candidatus Wunengus sp. YC65 TaxID=3367701 RepID=UPI00402A57F5